MTRAWVECLQKWKMGWNVSVESDRGGVISYYFPYILFSSHYLVGGRYGIFHLCKPLWHQWYCQFSVAIDSKYVVPFGVPMHVPI